MHFPSHATTDSRLTAPSSSSPQINRFHFTQPMNPTNAITAPPKDVSRGASGTKHSGSGSQKRQDALGRMAQISKKPINRVLAAKPASSSSSTSEKIPQGLMKSRKRSVAEKEIVLQMFPQHRYRETCIAKTNACTREGATCEAASVPPHRRVTTAWPP